MELLVPSLTMGTQFTDRLTDRPQVGIVGVRLEASLIGERQHLVVDTGRVTDTQDIDTPVHQFL